MKSITIHWSTRVTVSTVKVSISSVSRLSGFSMVTVKVKRVSVGSVRNQSTLYNYKGLILHQLHQTCWHILQ